MKKVLLCIFAALGLHGFAHAQTLAAYQAEVLGQNPSAYFRLDGDLVDAIGGTLTLASNGFPSLFMPDAFHNTTNACGFLNSADGLVLDGDIIAGGGTPDAGAAGKGSITLLFRALDGLTTGQKFILYQGNVTPDGNALSLFFENNTALTDPCTLKLRVGDNTVSILASNDIAFSAWYYFAMTYDESRDVGEVHWYLGRVGAALAAGTVDLRDDAVVGDNGQIIVGNQTNLTSSFRNPGRGRIDEVAFWSGELSDEQITNQFTRLPDPVPVNSIYQQVVTAQNPAYYFKLDDSLVDSVSGTLELSTNGVTGAFTTNVLGEANAAYSFASTNDALFITNDIISGGGPAVNDQASGVGSITLLFRMLEGTNTGQRFLFGQGINSPNRLSAFLENTNINNGDPNSLKLRAGNTTATIAQPSALITNAWHYLAITFDETRNTSEIHWYFAPVGGALTSGIFDFANNAIVGDNGTFTIGNRTNGNDTVGFRNPGSGAIDEFATYFDELAPDEIAAQFNSITNVLAASGPPPDLTLRLEAPNVVLSWPASNGAGFGLESARTLVSPAWTNAGSPALSGSSFVVTNVLSGGNSFYRLHKP